MDGQCSEGFILLILIITPLKGRIEVQILEVTYSDYMAVV